MSQSEFMQGGSVRLAAHQGPIEGKRPKTIYEERVCGNEDCITRISKYNPSDLCYYHTPFRKPRIRGKK